MPRATIRDRIPTDLPCCLGTSIVTWRYAGTPLISSVAVPIAEDCHGIRPPKPRTAATASTGPAKFSLPGVAWVAHLGSAAERREHLREVAVNRLTRPHQRLQCHPRLPGQVRVPRILLVSGHHPASEQPHLRHWVRDRR